MRSTQHELAMRSTQRELAIKLAYHDIRSWQLHDAKTPIALIDAISHVYALLYGISYTDAQSTLEPLVTAAWMHDIAETAEDAGDERTAHMYWGKAREHLVEHYTRLIEKLGGDHDQNVAEQVAEHDYRRWQVHHRRDKEGFLHHDASMRALLLGIDYEQSIIASRYITEAVWLHNKTDLRVDRSNDEKDIFWRRAEQKMVAHYEYVLQLLQVEVTI